MENKDGQIPAFFFIPDISGFTKFIATADINFTKEVIPALLRKLIDANKLKMNVGEIEGDAIFFYKTGRLPSVSNVAKQCRHIYQIFMEFIQSLELNDPENYHKYLSKNQLGLKVIVHFGPISIANIKGRIKLLGGDVIVAHKLLKNSIDEVNYILLTKKYLAKIRGTKKLAQYFHWEKLHPGKEEFEHIGEVEYYYITMDKLEIINQAKPKISKKLA